MSKKKITYFFIACILLSTLILFYFSISAFAINDSIFKNRKFNEQTFIGPFGMEGLSNKEARTKLDSDFSELHSKFAVDLTFQDVTVSLPSEIVEYDVDKTLLKTNSGEENPIIVNVSLEGLRTVVEQQFPTVRMSEISLQAIAVGVEKELESGFMSLNLHIIDFIRPTDLVNSEFATATINLEDPSAALLELLSKLNGYTVEPSSSFSMLEFIEANGAGLLNDKELTQVASVLYATILQTNFTIDERTISSTLPTNIQPGFEAAINKNLGLDFVFTNTNRTPFTINALNKDSTLQTSLTGVELLYSYDLFIGTFEEYAPKTVRRFSSFVPKGQVKVEMEGVNGVDVELLRNISYQGSIIHEETVSSDFYAPVPKIEIHSLKEDSTTETELNESENANDGADAVGNGSIQQETSSNGGSPGISSTEIVNNSNQPDKSVEEEGHPTDENGKVIQYDKGGNIIE